MKNKITFITTSLLLIGSLFYAQGKSNGDGNDLKITQIMQYSMPQVVRRCQKDFGYTDVDMIILERELKRFLAISVVVNPSYLGMFSKDVDNLWHSFILFTKEYAEFSSIYAGRFLHHEPETDESKSPEKLAQSRQYFLDFLEMYKSLFGEEAHDIWFLDMCEAQNRV